MQARHALKAALWMHQGWVDAVGDIIADYAKTPVILAMSGNHLTPVTLAMSGDQGRYKSSMEAWVDGKTMPVTLINDTPALLGVFMRTQQWHGSSAHRVVKDARDVKDVRVVKDSVSCCYHEGGAGASAIYELEFTIERAFDEGLPMIVKTHVNRTLPMDIPMLNTVSTQHATPTHYGIAITSVRDVTSDLYRYSQADHSWKRLVSMPYGSQIGLGAIGLITLGYDVFGIGYRRAIYYTASQNTCQELPEPSHAYSYCQPRVDDTQCVYVAGGRSTLNRMPGLTPALRHKCERWSVVEQCWQSLPDTLYERWSAGAVICENRWILMGGRSELHSSQVFRHIEWLDLHDPKQWHDGGDALQEPREEPLLLVGYI